MADKQDIRPEDWSVLDHFTGNAAAPETHEPSRVSSGELVIPQPGETWLHESHGKVKIIRKWNERESVCELLEAGNRRALLMNCLMKRVLAEV